MSLESRLIDWFHQNIPPSSRLAVGLGDDAAVVQSLGEKLVVTTDLVSDQVDFLLDEVEPRRVGHKALGVNLSDLAAMAAEPVAAFVSLLLPEAGSSKLSAFDLAVELYRGMLPLAENCDIAIGGGDINSWRGPLVINITALGRTTEHGPLLRSGAQPGDRLLITGQVGGSLLGRHLDVEPRVREALLLNADFQLHAGIDISDGVAIDASRLATASNLGVVIDPNLLPISAAAHRLSDQDSRSPTEHALGDGEDFELLLAVDAQQAEQILREQPLAIPITQIGEFINESGLWQIDDSGARTPLEATGYQHGGEQ